ncbi:mannose-6-phosphate isomerase, class I [Bacillus subtilis]|uniref:mannose-6-phosphate isomerase, class I n=1 Tax=Bacillus subtilis TaxID=1423 RepID=UPI0002B40421|nr:mannose-6-phosphate isomerase, class I [Bacillus subtilis]AGE65186.1 putative phosphohexomutase; cupin family [Bacillus subtilis XF-1]AGI30730.1 putative phosphohexomutase; cupin family protein [Bacillus subtilis subsp. subtilis str. BAB-1]AKD36792.1 phosphohexomutase [Bacillus subtilis HJ5]ALS80501.1 mannose-6-phosphate isomerase [Bacillus subtilis subsp. subtilis]ASK25614.1 putative phosphohexomutase [Bacillus subtilis]
MTQSPIFLTPVFKEKIWGGTALRDRFGYSIPSESTGECWAISAHPKGPSTVANGPYKGKTLIELWKEHREIFGGVEGDQFPLLTKLLDVKEDTSIKVHPDDYYAGENEEGELGKTECWYIIDCKDNAEIIYGHTARSKTELVTMINSGDWEGLLRRIKIKPGDFYYVPSGTLHALCKGALVLETQQNSDATYRVYDYDRLDSNGSPRELHFAKAVNAATVPHVDGYIDESTESRKGITIKTFVQGEYFSVYKWDINGEAEMAQDESFLICSVIEGSGLLMYEDKTCPLKKGDHFILPAQMPDFTIKGTCTLIVSHI